MFCEDPEIFCVHLALIVYLSSWSRGSYGFIGFEDPAIYCEDFSSPLSVEILSMITPLITTIFS
jgi:hypothetical protein